MLELVYRTVRNGLAVCLLVAAAVGTWYWSRSTAPVPVDTSRSSSAPLGYYLRDAVVLGTDDQGRVFYRINADLAEERPEDGALLLNGVRVEFQSDEQVPWQLSALRAEATPDGGYLELEGDVTLERKPSEDRRLTRVETASLRLEPEQHLAVASGEVRFTVGENSLHAVGLKAFLKEDRVELASDGYGRFVP